MRLGEKEGRDYFFINESTFYSLRKNKRILEWTKYLGYYYGTKKDLLELSLKKGKNVLLCLDFKGANRIKKLYPKDSITIFIIPPSLGELRKRIEGRSVGTREEEISKRISRAEGELRNISAYDYSLKNINLVQAIKRLKGIILKEVIKQ
jgi:guanylate kinase